jgi:hypothetical protein
VSLPRWAIPARTGWPPCDDFRHGAPVLRIVRLALATMKNLPALEIAHGMCWIPGIGLPRNDVKANLASQVQAVAEQNSLLMVSDSEMLKANACVFPASGTIACRGKRVSVMEGCDKLFVSKSSGRRNVSGENGSVAGELLF